METKELKIIVPKGFEIDRENSTFEKIIFKKIDTKPKSWKEFCEKFPKQEGEVKIAYFSGIDAVISGNHRDDDDDKNVLPSKECAEAFIAMMQLISLRQVWIGDWKPDWNSGDAKFLIVYRYGRPNIDLLVGISHPLSFPTKEMAQEFLKCFKDLIEKAEPLL